MSQEREACHFDRQVQQEIALLHVGLEDRLEVAFGERVRDKRHAGIRRNAGLVFAAREDRYMRGIEIDMAQQQRECRLPDAAEAQHDQLSRECNVPGRGCTRFSWSHLGASWIRGFAPRPHSNAPTTSIARECRRMDYWESAAAAESAYGGYACGISPTSVPVNALSGRFAVNRRPRIVGFVAQFEEQRASERLEHIGLGAGHFSAPPAHRVWIKGVDRIRILGKFAHDARATTLRMKIQDALIPRLADEVEEPAKRRFGFGDQILITNFPIARIGAKAQPGAHILHPTRHAELPRVARVKTNQSTVHDLVPGMRAKLTSYIATITNPVYELRLGSIRSYYFMHGIVLLPMTG